MLLQKSTFDKGKHMLQNFLTKLKVDVLRSLWPAAVFKVIETLIVLILSTVAFYLIRYAVCYSSRIFFVKIESSIIKYRRRSHATTKRRVLLQFRIVENMIPGQCRECLSRNRHFPSIRFTETNESRKTFLKTNYRKDIS